MIRSNFLKATAETQLSVYRSSFPKHRSPRALVLLDLDDTVLSLKTVSKFDVKSSGEVVTFNSRDLPAHDHLIGPEEHKPYAYRSDSFDEFGSGYFVRHIVEQLHHNPRKLDTLPASEVYARSLECNSADTAIITARGASPESMYIGLGLMTQGLGIGGYMRKERIHPCNYQNTAGLSTSLRKLMIVEDYLDQAQRSSITDVMPLRSIDGVSKRPMNFALYADDHPKTIETMKNKLLPQIGHRWPDLKVLLWHVGDGMNEDVSSITMLGPDHRERPVAIDELEEELSQIFDMKKNEMMA